MSAKTPISAVLLWIVFSANTVNAQSNLYERHKQQRDVFLELQSLLGDGHLNDVKSRRSEIDGYPIADYLDFLILQREIEGHARAIELLPQVRNFTGDSKMQRRLIGAIKNRSAKNKQWADFRKASVGENVPVHPCDDMYARFQKKSAIKFTKEIGELWADVSRHTSRCRAAFDKLLSKVSDVPTGPLWERTVALIKRSDVKSAKHMLRYFNRRDGRIVRSWIDGLKNPEKVLRSKAVRGTSEYHREMALVLLRRWARNDLVEAHEFWRKDGKHYGYSNAQVSKRLSESAVLAAKRGMPEASALLAQVESTRDVRYWRVRVALQSNDWDSVRRYIEALSVEERAETRWQYWYARALEADGYTASATQIYQSIAGKFEYYGFLAADKVLTGYQIDVSRPQANDAELQFLRESSQIARAIEYFLIGVPWEGRSTWNNALKTAGHERLVAAAQIANSVGWYDRAVIAMASADEEAALDTLFPAPFGNYVERFASDYAVEREFIYGVMRRESRFITDIRSHAGAVGLMQLMPATAKQMGKELGIKAPRWRLIESELNIKLGVRYLGHVLNRFDNHMVLAAAAYNAGPHRVKKWLERGTVDADVWVEVIPFDETRDYVKAVLFNTTVSEKLSKDGALTRLQQRMPYIGAGGLSVSNGG